MDFPELFHSTPCISNVILKHLPVISIISLGRTCRSMRNHLNGMIYTLYKRRYFWYLEYCLGIGPMGFFEIFGTFENDDDVHISGSSVLAVLTGDFWHDVDVDVFMRSVYFNPYNHYMSLFKHDHIFMDKCTLFLQGLLKRGYTLHSLCTDDHVMVSNSGYYDLCVDLVQTLRIGQKKTMVQLIFPRKWPHIQDFDFSFCKNTFNVHALTIDDFESVLRKRCNGTTNVPLRYEKYVRRGFSKFNGNTFTGIN